MVGEEISLLRLQATMPPAFSRKKQKFEENIEDQVSPTLKKPKPIKAPPKLCKFGEISSEKAKCQFLNDDDILCLYCYKKGHLIESCFLQNPLLRKRKNKS